ncbi:MAG: hypothetical protein AB1742_14855 [bacterium]
MYSLLERAILRGEFNKDVKKDDSTKYMIKTQVFLKSLVAILSFAQIENVDIRKKLYERLMRSNPELLLNLKKQILNKMQEEPEKYTQFSGDVRFIDEIIEGWERTTGLE